MGTAVTLIFCSVGELNIQLEATIITSLHPPRHPEHACNGYAFW